MQPRIVVFPRAGYTLLEGAHTSRAAPGGSDRREEPLESERDLRWRTTVAPGAACVHELLLTGTAREVLARILPEDPLGLRARLAARVRERALLLDLDAVLLRALALCSLHAATWRGEPELERWLEVRVEESLAAVLAEDPEDTRGEPLTPVAAPLALDPRALARACARFNRLAFEQREAFFALVLDGVVADRLARARKLSLPELARRARAGLEIILCALRAFPPAGLGS